MHYQRFWTLEKDAARREESITYRMVKFGSNCDRYVAVFALGSIIQGNLPKEERRGEEKQRGERVPIKTSATKDKITES